MVVDGTNCKPMSIRVIQIYPKRGREWRLVHRHGDFAPTGRSAAKLD
jgi:hypothetical protein